MTLHRTPALLTLALAACAGAPEPGEPRAPRGEDSGTAGEQPGTDSGETDSGVIDSGVTDSGQVDSGEPTDTGDDGDTGTPPAPQPLRFIALGDGGRGNAEQYSVAAGMEQICAEKGCDFAVYLGDNIYDDGVSSVDDEQFETKFELPYSKLAFPFYMALGNHDWNSGPSGAAAQVEYTARSTKWVMRDEFYTHTQGDATFFVLDTNTLAHGDVGPQEAWLPGEIAQATTTWKFAYGHHPYISNGDHGDTGGDFGTFFEQHLCGKVDVYFAGHDHDLQWLQPSCGVEHVVSGGASSLRATGQGSNPTFYESSTRGFLWVELDGHTMTGVFYDEYGTELYRRVVQK